MFKIHLVLLLVGICPFAAAAQSPAVMPPSIDAERDANASETRSESQPPEQGGQAQQMMKEARVELERSALAIEAADASERSKAVAIARESLAQFEESLGQLHQSVPGYVPLELATSLKEQVVQTLALLNSDTTAASLSMRELALRVTDLTANADLLVGRTLLGSDDIKLGIISNVLITADGRVQALVVDRQTLSKNQQFVVEWADVSVVGSNLVAKLSITDADKLPDYFAD
jgi:sporulation protein YlmC with PRC-barrel domain